MAFTPSVKKIWNLFSHTGASSVPPPCLSIFLNIWPQGFYKVRVLRVKRRSTGSRLSSTSCLPKIGFRPVGQWKHFLFPSSFSQHSVTRISTIVKIWSKIFCNKDTINCILLQYADPKMAGLIKEGPAIFGSAYCIYEFSPKFSQKISTIFKKDLVTLFSKHCVSQAFFRTFTTKRHQRLRKCCSLEQLQK